MPDTQHGLLRESGGERGERHGEEAEEFFHGVEFLPY
jgi:hypothetical protein